MVIHGHNHSTQTANRGGSQVQGQCGLCSKGRWKNTNPGIKANLHHTQLHKYPLVCKLTTGWLLILSLFPSFLFARKPGFCYVTQHRLHPSWCLLSVLLMFSTNQCQLLMSLICDITISFSGFFPGLQEHICGLQFSYNALHSSRNGLFLCFWAQMGKRCHILSF